MLRWISSRRGLNARFRHAIAAEEQAGLTFAFRARIVAVAAVIIWLLLLIDPQRQLYYVSVAAAFLLFGFVPHLMRRHRYAVAIRLAFALLDVILVTAVVVLPPPGNLDIGWPIQTRIRGPEFLYLVLLIAGAALTYSPLQVLWTGLCVVAAWSAAVVTLYLRDDTVSFGDRLPGSSGMPLDSTLQILMSPYHVSIFFLMNQVVLTLIVTAVLAAAVWRSRAMLVRQTRAEIARADLSRYVSPDVADAIMTADQPFGAPNTRQVGILFADIVGFTGLSEHMTPDRIVLLLKSFQQRCCAVVFRHGGSLDKYMGDGFLATFGAITELPDVAARALHCAAELQQEMDRWNAKRAARGAVRVPLSIGVDCGAVVVGNIGSESRLEFTVVGDTVNTASRLEAATRQLNCRIATSQSCLQAAAAHSNSLPEFASVGPLRLEGREQAVDVCIWPVRERPDHSMAAV